MTVKTIGIAGGIGSGKSTVTEYLRKKGYVVIDADEVSHAVTEAGQPAPGEIAELFGPETLLPGGSLDRRYMADIVFRDEAKLKSLNAILHKYIEEEVDTALQAAKSSGPVFLSAPLFFEANYERKTDEVWLISAADEIRIRRAAARDNADEQAIIARMEKQMPESERRERADIIIENNATAKELFARIDSLLAAL